MALVRIVCDGGGSLGFGNLRRSATLGAEFKRAGFGVRVEAVSDEGRRLLPEAPHDSGEADVWLLDIPYNADDWVQQARQDKRPVSALDYQGIIAPDLVISIFQRETSATARQQLVGMEYAIIRPEIAALAPAPLGNGVLVVIGGGDRDGLGERAALALHEQGCVVTLVEGPLAAPSTAKLPPQISRLSNPVDLAVRMASCEWGVTSGGGTMMEMLCLGKAVHVLPRTTHEGALARLVYEQGAALGVGFETLQIPDANVSQITSVRARALVDGKGASRIVEAVASLL